MARFAYILKPFLIRSTHWTQRKGEQHFGAGRWNSRIHCTPESVAVPAGCRRTGNVSCPLCLLRDHRCSPEWLCEAGHSWAHVWSTGLTRISKPLVGEVSLTSYVITIAGLSQTELEALVTLQLNYGSNAFWDNHPLTVLDCSFPGRVLLLN